MSDGSEQTPSIGDPAVWLACEVCEVRMHMDDAVTVECVAQDTGLYFCQSCAHEAAEETRLRLVPTSPTPEERDDEHHS